ncbi:hypothetical protein Vpro01_03396 [Vibrio proteolyticus]
MKVYKPTCPECGGRNTTIRTSKRENIKLQVLYCDCLEEKCLTRFKVEAETTYVIFTLKEELSCSSCQGSHLDQLQLNLT